MHNNKEGMVLFILGSPMVFDKAQQAMLSMNPDLKHIPKAIIQEMQRATNKHINNMLMHCWRRRTQKVKEIQGLRELNHHDNDVENEGESAARSESEQHFRSYLFPDMRTKYKVNKAKEMQARNRQKHKKH